MADDRPPPLAGISHLGFSVTNLDRSLVFYRDVLGATVLREPYLGDRETFSGRLALVMLDSVGLDLFEHEANSGETFAPVRTGLDHLALAARSRDELQQWAARLDALGIARSPIRDGGGVGEMFDFADPDGIQLEFYFLDPERFGTQ